MAEDDRDSQEWRLESLVGSRVLLGAGLISLLAGAAFFVKLSNDHQWIPPQVRILCGLFAGLVLLFGGAWQLGKARTLVAEGVTGLGASVLYLSLWAAYGPFGLIPREVALAAMVAVCAALAAISWRRNSQNVALAGLAGGYLTPLLLTGGSFPPATLAVYLAVLSGAMLALAVRCRYRLVEAASFCAALLYAPAFVPSAEWTQTQSLLTATALFAEFAAGLFFIARRDARVDTARIALLVAEVAAYLGVLELELGWDQHTLAFADAALAATLLVAVAFRVPAAMRATYAWLGLGILTRAVDAWGGSSALTATLAIEGASMAFAGIRSARPWMRTAGYGVVALAAFGAASQLMGDVETQPFFNRRAWDVAAVVVSLVMVIRDARSYGPTLRQLERDAVAPLAAIVAVVLAFAGVSVEVVTATAGAGEWTATTQTALTAAWSLMATVMIALGFRARFSLVRWMAIGLFAITAAKVFAVDLVWLDVMARAVSALVVGAVLVIVAAGYQIVMLRGRGTP
jgi:uncharacterized membrane protein